MFKKITLLAIALTSSALATDLTKIPFETADGKKVSLADYKGKAVLLVNVASKCGLTGQYSGLQKLYEANKGKGLIILGFPCNDFAGQEPGTAGEVVKFCSTEYAVTFPIMAKIHVKGDEQHPLYQALTGAKGPFPGDTKWNFGKILIGKDGAAIARFGPTTSPDSDELAKAIADALAK